MLAIGITGTVKAAVNGQILAALSGSFVGDPSRPLQLMSELVGENTLVIIVSMAIGALIGQLLDLDRGISYLGERVEHLARARFGNVAQGFGAPLVWEKTSLRLSQVFVECYIRFLI